MQKLTPVSIFLIMIAAFLLPGCGGKNTKGAADSGSYAIYAEYARDNNKTMHDGINRRMFFMTEAQAGNDIGLVSNLGTIRLEPGTYRINGFSLVTAQAELVPPTPGKHGNYPGYCILYPAHFEKDSSAILLKNAIAIGSPQNAYDMAPSIFDAVYHTDSTVYIALGHQSGYKLYDTIYLSVFRVGKDTSNYHAFARIAITKLD